MSKERCTFKDKSDHEWMKVTQYQDALLDDFNISVSHSLISLARSGGKLNPKYCEKMLGKNLINYTASVPEFLDTHPNIAPPNLPQALKQWTKKLSVKATDSMETRIIPDTKVPAEKPKYDMDAEDDDDDLELSVSLEKAKHERIKREKAEFEFDIFKGQYINIGDVDGILQQIAIETRQSSKAMIPRIASILASMVDVHEIKALLEKETDVALNHINRLDDIIDGTFAADEAKKQEGDL